MVIANESPATNGVPPALMVKPMPRALNAVPTTPAAVVPSGAVTVNPTPAPAVVNSTGYAPIIVAGDACGVIAPKVPFPVLVPKASAAAVCAEVTWPSTVPAKTLTAPVSET